MDYLLDQYVFNYLPFAVTPETRRSVGQRALTIVQWADWFCKYESPMKILQNNPYFFMAEFLFLFLGLLTFLHACRHGARHLYVWVGFTVLAFATEWLSFSVPEMNVAWHAQGVLSFFGMRVPLYALFGIHQTFGYTAYVLVSRMYLPWYAEGPAAGLCSVMLVLPYRIIGTKLLWWTWHDTDPTVNDRMYWVPWSSLCQYGACITSFLWILKLSRYHLLDKEYDWTKFVRELCCAVFAGLISLWMGALQFSIFYYPLHHILGVHSEVVTVLFFASNALVVFTADRNNIEASARKGSRYWFDELSCAIALEFMFLMVLAVIADPVNIVSEGIHQPIGPCHEKEDVVTAVGFTFQREKYLCATKYGEKYFDFHCVPNGIPRQQDDGLGKLAPLEYYAICGTNFNNRAEYVTVIWGCCIIFGLIAHQMAACSGATPIDPIKIHRRVFRSNGSSPSNAVVHERSKQKENMEQREPLIPAKQDVLDVPVTPSVPIKAESESKAKTEIQKVLYRKSNSVIPVSTRVLRSHSRKKQERA